jgi:hypothetical protein
MNINKGNDIHTLENNITTNRTTSMASIREYIDTSLVAFGPLTNFYSQRNIQGLNFLNYQGRQRMEKEMLKILINGGQKYGPSPDAQDRMQNPRQQDRERPRRRRRRRRRTNIEPSALEQPPPKLR